MGKSTISMVMFNKKIGKSHFLMGKSTINHHFLCRKLLVDQAGYVEQRVTIRRKKPRPSDRFLLELDLIQLGLETEIGPNSGSVI